MPLSDIASRVAGRHLAATHKHAGDRDIMSLVLPERGLIELMDTMEKAGDEESSKLAYACYQKLAEKLQLSNNEEYGLARLQQCVKAVNSWAPAMQRNTIFKAADLLGVPLPSHHFASEHVAGPGDNYLNGKKTVATSIELTTIALARAEMEFRNLADVVHALGGQSEKALRDASERLDAMKGEVYAFARLVR